ncbi:MAG: polysaccharide lyase 6 family protein [Prolixibacteraceae bacterium]
MRIFLSVIIVAGLLLTERCIAQNTVNVKDLTSLQLEINKAQPGTTIILKDGVYAAEKPILLNLQGKPDQPITISAATTGGVEIKGTSGFVVGESAAYIVVDGFKFTHEAGKTKIDAGARFCRFTRNVFECTGKGPYFSVYGDDCQVDYNTFQNKSTEGQMISVQGPGGSGMAQRTWIHHNYFHNFTPVSNNCSSIQIGLSGRSLSSAKSLVEYNLFSETRGENENICNKSCDNIYRFNTFGEGCSELSLRHGNGCQVYGNFFIGSEGVRFYGHNHKIFSNYFERCNPAINIGNGDGIVPRDKLTSHDRPDSVYVVFNTLVNNKKNIMMQGRNNGLGATCITVANNIIQGGSVAFKIDGNIVQPVWEGNLVWKTDGTGNIPSSGYKEIDPKLIQQKAESAHIQNNSPAKGQSSGNYPFVKVDIDGQARSSKPDTGADQFLNSEAINHVLTVNEVGPKARK